jgi:3',5'-cyclic AMP phosphodiesterase CpdA
VLIAQITDTHIKEGGRTAYDGKVDTARALRSCIAHLNGLDPKPDVVLLTGDLVDQGRKQEYAALARLLAPLSIPLYVIPGNHDERGALRDAFADEDYLPAGEFLHYAVDRFPVRLVGLDTTVPGAPHGEMCAARLAWLDETLRRVPERPTIVFMHHPPFLTGIGHMDVQNCRGGDALAAVLHRHPQVVRLLCGHVHRSIQAVWHGIGASIAPSHSHAVALDLRTGGPSAFTLEPPACHLHHWREDVGLVSHLSFIGTYPGPFPFFDERGRLID